MNNSGQHSHADFRSVLDLLGAFGREKLDGGQHHSVYYDYLDDWQKFCRDPAHRELKDCDCTISDDDGEPKDPGEPEEGEEELENI